MFRGYPPMSIPPEKEPPAVRPPLEEEPTLLERILFAPLVTVESGVKDAAQWLYKNVIIRRHFEEHVLAGGQSKQTSVLDYLESLTDVLNEEVARNTPPPLFPENLNILTEWGENSFALGILPNVEPRQWFTFDMVNSPPVLLTGTEKLQREFIASAMAAARAIPGEHQIYHVGTGQENSKEDLPAVSPWLKVHRLEGVLHDDAHPSLIFIENIEGIMQELNNVPMELREMYPEDARDADAFARVLFDIMANSRIHVVATSSGGLYPEFRAQFPWQLVGGKIPHQFTFRATDGQEYACWVPKV